jgi:hypothetical protein
MRGLVPAHLDREAPAGEVAGTSPANKNRVLRMILSEKSATFRDHALWMPAQTGHRVIGANFVGSIRLFCCDTV